MTDHTPLSPAAAAVKDAAYEAWYTKDKPRSIAAAALRAAADQIAEMYNKKPADIDNIDVLTLSELVRIAAELEAQ